MKIFKRILIGLLIILIILQFFRPEKNISDKPQPNAIAMRYAVPANVQSILNKACNDCHSNNTKYPWYSKIQPVAWWLNDHIQEGKHGLNFDEFLSYSLRKQYHRMEDTQELVKENEMPLDSYTWIHKDAKLSMEEKNAILNWAQSIRDTMQAHYPIDSLIKKK